MNNNDKNKMDKINKKLKDEKNKKKMLIVLPKMSMGGMERSVANLLKLSNYSKNYDITLLVGYKTDDSLFCDIPDNINVKILCNGKWNAVNKITTAIKYVCEYLKLKVAKPYDISICYSHHHSMLAKITKVASPNNNIIFIHSDLILARTKKQIKKMDFCKFSKIVCVSNAAKKSFETLFPAYSKEQIFVINNYIDGEKIQKLAKEDIDFESLKLPSNVFDTVCFVNVARHLESAKKITRIIDSTKKLKEEGYNFKVILVGSGKDSLDYEKKIRSYGLNDTIYMVGNRENPYNILKNASAFILSSSFEGYGMVLDEARVLNIPIITTNVADSNIITNEGYGICCDNNTEGVYNGMKEFLDKGYVITSPFDYTAFNSRITKNLDILVNENNNKDNKDNKKEGENKI